MPWSSRARWTARRWLLAPHRERLRSVGRRSREVLVLAGIVGVLTGLVVAAFDELVAEGILARLLEQPLWLQALAPGVGLGGAAVALRVAGRGTSPATADEYIKGFHARDGMTGLRLVPYRLAAAVATLGGGAPMGYEGPALYAGAGIGAAVQSRLRRFAAADRNVLLVSGAAAGVAAIFKAPVTGIVFALEVPYQDDLARRMLLPASIAAATSYVTFAAIVGTDAILPVAGQPPFDLPDLGGAALVGVAAGLLARIFIGAVRLAKEVAGSGHPAVRVAIAGAVLAGTVLLAHAVEDGALALGPGYGTLDWAMDPRTSVAAVIAIATLRVAGTTAALGGGGVGGLFIPLVMQGALVGRVVGGALGVENTTLLPVVGMAAFLGAGYRVPLAAVVFVAEFTGRPGFVVPGLIGAVVAQLVSGTGSVSPYQAPPRWAGALDP